MHQQRETKHPRVVAAAVGIVAAVAVALAANAFAAAKGTAAVKAKVSKTTLQVTGTAAADDIALRLQAGAPDVLEVVVGGATSSALRFNRAKFDRIVVEARDGDDTLSVDESNGAFLDEAVTLDGEEGNDTITGGSGADNLVGDTGNDTVAGRRGDDTATLGGGDDSFAWNPGDGSDVVEGQGGIDTLAFNGANIAESIDVSANGTRVRFTRNIASIVMDLGSLERIDFDARGGADIVQVNSLAGTPLARMTVNLGADGSPDAVNVRGTPAADNIRVTDDAGTMTVTGLSAEVRATNAEAANDVLFVDPADGADRVTFDGSPANDTIAITPNGGHVVVTSSTAALPLDVTATETLVANGLGGSDAIVAANGLSTLTSLTIDGGAGDDSVTGGDGADAVLGGDGNDAVAGGRGNDTASLGAGDDTFTWNPGDGSDTVEGQDGADTLDFNGANIGEEIDVAANGSRVRFTRNVASIVMDVNGTERVGFDALGGADNVTVHDLAGTSVQQVAVDLAATGGGGDAAPDVVKLVGNAAANAFRVSADGGAALVTGLAASLRVANGEAANDALQIDPDAGADSVTAAGSAGDDTFTLFPNGTAVRLTANGFAIPVDSLGAESIGAEGAGGADTITAFNGLATLASLRVDGGPGNDTIVGGDGADVIVGGDGDDTVSGGRGNDTAFLGAGDDSFAWNPGDGSDTVEGQDGADRLLFNGANIGEELDASANGTRVRLTRNVASVVMDFDGVEALAVRALGGADTFRVHDLGGTALTQVLADLASGVGGGDLSPDTIVVDGTSGNDVIPITGSNGVAEVLGLYARVDVTGAEPANDSLVVRAFAGDDVVDGSALAATVLHLTEDGGDGDDVLIGSQGPDTLLGGNGDDVLLGGPGVDVLDGGPGNNILIQD